MSGFALSKLDRIEPRKSIVNKAVRMRLRRKAALLLAATALAVPGCSKAGSHERHAQAVQTPEVPPTPDTTPVEALRTPAGLVLRVGETPPALTPAPTASPAAGKPAA